MRAIVFISITFLLVSLQDFAWGFQDKAISVGISYYSQNIMNKTAQSETGETKFLGTTHYPLNLQYDFRFAGDLYVAPRLSYVLFPRQAAGNTAKVSFWHLALPFGKNISESNGIDWDVYGGPGLIRYEIKGAGGTTEMNNGTSTATFAVPGDTKYIQKITLTLGSSVAYEQSRLGFDLIFENFFSSKERAQSLMISYAYQFKGKF